MRKGSVTVVGIPQWLGWCRYTPSTVKRHGRGWMNGGLLYFSVVAAFVGTSVMAGEPPVGSWRVIDADYSDRGHCAMTETIEMSLSLRRTAGGVAGEYVEAEWRDGDFGNCPRLGGFQATYDVALMPAPAGREGYIAHLTLRDCRDRAKPHCRELEAASKKPLSRSRDRDGIVLGGIFLGRVK